MSARFKVFRWRAIGPLLFFFAVFIVLWILFADGIARRQSEDALSDLLGTQVDIRHLRIREADAAVDIGGLAIADPRDSTRNLIEAEDLTFDLDPVALAEKKIVIDRVSLLGLGVLTRRETPARRVSADGPTAQLIRQTDEWARDKFTFPSLALGRLDSLKQLVLNPEHLGTVKAVTAVVGRLDSLAGSARRTLDQIAAGTLVDSATALADRLAVLDPRKTSPLEIKNLVEGADHLRRRLDGAGKELAAVQKTVTAVSDGLTQSLAEVNAARERDYAFARGLLKLPDLNAPQFGAGLFGPVSLASFQRALVYAQVAQRYVPPGLQPWNRPGPKRARLAGSDVEFPRERAYPRFLLRQGEVSLGAGEQDAHAFQASFGGITSQPALYGKPATLSASGKLGGREVPLGIQLGVYSLHAGGPSKDSMTLRLTDIELPAIEVEGVPFTLTPGRGTVGFAFAMSGERIAGTWTLAAPSVRWAADTSRVHGETSAEGLLWRVLRGLTDLKVRADLGGTLASPTLAVRSNLDDAVAGSLRAMLGEELEKAEAKAREAVDQLVGPQVAALRGQYDTFMADLAKRVPLEQGQLDAADKRLAKEVKRLTTGALGGIQIPKL
ncbi:MAG: TIGR03545 family protein [Gemmatimonadota bacterium]|nr:TIGR03545 family protein [Gemmatimonadota bacterium]MDH4347492.1 TIGR03545 family protein [Gemmatimonadota bacterium]